MREKPAFRAVSISETEKVDLAKELKNGRDYLASLQQLADLQPKKAKKYLKNCKIWLVLCAFLVGFVVYMTALSIRCIVRVVNFLYLILDFFDPA